MKIFALYFRVNLVQKPEWFDNFRKKYDKDYDLHITLIQPRYIDELRLGELKQKISEFLNKNKLEIKDKIVEFNILVCDKKGSDANIFMLLVEKQNILVDFQKKLRDVLSDFESYVDDETKNYEVDFKPHITIGRDIADQDLLDVENYFESEYIIKGDIAQMVLPVVNDATIKEVTNSKNLTVYNF